jgi:hypothetical protein
MKRIKLASILVVVLLCSGVALAQTGGEYDLTWWTVDGGGGAASGGSYALVGTAGQLDAGPALSGGGYTLVGGFWPAAGSAVAGSGKVYLPLVVK